MRISRLDAAFFRQPSAKLARALLGKALVCGDRAGIIVETEAYLDGSDRASHARFGRTARNAVMFGPGGVAYVYLCYGIHQMMNVVADEAGAPSAVLLRALSPLSGLGESPEVARGPGKLTRALGITRKAHHAVDLAKDARLFIADVGHRVAKIASGPRVGIDYAGDWAHAELRFWIHGNPAVSKPPRAKAKPQKQCRA